jgi:O-antigen ligase
MLFLYGATGARASFRYNPEKFIRTVLTGCEWIAFVSAFVYLVLKIPMFGNPNSLGAIMAFVEPLLLWDALTNPSKDGRSRRIAALCFSGLLLYTSVARAAILGAAVATVVLCTILRRHRMLSKVALVSILLVSLAGVLEPARFSNFVDSVTGSFLYKNNEQSGILGSRLSPWSKASETIQKHPFFGSGFGTRTWLSVGDVSQLQLSRSIHDFEYGSSYVSIVDYTGIVGAGMFGLLLFLLIQRIWQVCRFVWRSRDFSYQAIPFVMIVIVGVIHAGFEDWMFAAGSYICVFFWPCAFLLMDMVPPRTQRSVLNPFLRRQVSLHPGFASVQPRGLQTR